ncbi:CheR family methyltransferase [Laribacter hongkongensis]|uniref:CheR family methyltransferase n=1 Tax=Laribacter hongkongensis TaxID=168471 RepID=UPI001878767F|nr:CheR family methyltransferase [Laribacter hongkongensis]MCG9095975.1 chemotaxis protein CheR [Laribacter hongkongensis]
MGVVLMVEAGELLFERRDFERAASLIRRRCGVCLGEGKEHMVYARLARQVRKCGFSRFADYLDLLEEAPAHPEWQGFIGALTTHLTAFFRERHHFELLVKQFRTHPSDRPFRIWCAAVSTGEEAWSALMALCEERNSLTPRVELLATDVDIKVLTQAASGVYPLVQVEALPFACRSRYWLRGRGAQSGRARIRPELMSLARFEVMNLIESGWGKGAPFEAIFCRNVLIYFDETTRQAILKRLAGRLAPHGRLYLGHAENIVSQDTPFVSCGQTVYRLATTEVAV